MIPRPLPLPLSEHGGGLRGGTRTPRLIRQQQSESPTDSRVQEPNPDTGPMWVSQDIWVRNSPDPNYQPYPFTESSPPWTFPPHQDPVYRDPLKSTPNYI